jgi:hypothetical protein
MMFLSYFYVDTKVTLAYLSFHFVNTFDPGTVRVSIHYGLIRVTGDVKYMVDHFCLLAGMVCCGPKDVHGEKGGMCPFAVAFYIL